jgi:2'-5' RNA ligase
MKTRCFISIEIPPQLKNGLTALQKINCPASVIKEEQIHITVLFLGEVEEQKIQFLIKKLSEFEFQSFQVRLKNAGAFPSEKNPRVFWVGIESEELSRLNSELKKIAEAVGIEAESRKFQPHLTLGRIKEKCDLRSWAEQNKKDFGTFKVEKLLLKKSTPTQKGHFHETIK